VCCTQVNRSKTCTKTPIPSSPRPVLGSNVPEPLVLIAEPLVRPSLSPTPILMRFIEAYEKTRALWRCTQCWRGSCRSPPRYLTSSLGMPRKRVALQPGVVSLGHVDAAAKRAISGETVRPYIG
jgi:hypothetical protein